MSTDLFWIWIVSLLAFFSGVVYCERPIQEYLPILRPWSIQQYGESRNALGVLPTPYDTSGSGTSDNRLTSTHSGNCPECHIDIRGAEGNAEPSRSNDETLLPTPYDTSGSGTSDNRSTSTHSRNCPECHIDIRGAEGNAEPSRSNDETLQPPAYPNDEPSRLWLRIINCARIKINCLQHHLQFRRVEDPWLKLLATTLIQVSASTSVNSGSSLAFKIAIPVAFSASLSALLLHYNNGGRYLVKIGAIAYLIVMYEASVNNLSSSIMWVNTVTFLIPAVIVINA